MILIVNGREVELPAGATVRDLLRAIDAREDAVAVERNRAVVRRRDWDATALAPGDQVEVVTFVGGG